MSSESSDIIKVISKFLDPKSVKIEKLEKVDDILKLSIQSYKFIDKEESTIIKNLFEISKIKETLKLNKDDPFESLTILEESEQSEESLELKENLKEKIGALKNKYPTLEKKLRKAITISTLINSLTEV